MNFTTPDEVISDADARLREGMPSLTGVRAVILFKLSGPDGGDYHIVVDDGHGRAAKGTVADPDLTFSMPGDVLVAITQGEQNGVELFMTGQLRMRGDQALAMALAPLWFEGTDWAAHMHDVHL